MIEKALSALAVVTGKVNVSFNRLYTSGFVLSFFLSISFSTSPMILFVDRKSTFI